MPYSLRLFDADASDAQRAAAEKLFRGALDEALGHESMVLPVYNAYLRIVATYGEAPDTELLSDAEREIFTQWQAAEAAALAATFGPHRYMGDAMYEIGPA
ncbi:MAG: hypothetical protein HYX47_02880 [Burkholderiales bacterium]|nr:hypothetical protein [Burkholderiales bacterium]